MSYPIRCVPVSLLALLLALPAPVAAQTSSVSFSSGPGWTAADSGGTPIGNAQNVCLNASAPSPCPAGATLWGYGGSGWGQSLAAIAGATWIWAPGLTGTSPNASLARYSFSNTITVGGTPVTGTVYMLADDLVELRVNGTLVGTVGSISDPSQSGAGRPALVQFDVLPHLVSGANTFTFTAQNGSDLFGGVPNANYSQNPAGTVFGGTITYTPPVPTMGGWVMIGLAGLLLIIAARRLRPAVA